MKYKTIEDLNDAGICVGTKGQAETAGGMIDVTIEHITMFDPDKAVYSFSCHKFYKTNLVAFPVIHFKYSTIPADKFTSYDEINERTNNVSKSEKKIKSFIFEVTLDVGCGSNIGDVVEDAYNISKFVNANVHFKFNDITIIVHWKKFNSAEQARSAVCDEYLKKLHK